MTVQIKEVFKKMKFKYVLRIEEILKAQNDI